MDLSKIPGKPADPTGQTQTGPTQTGQTQTGEPTAASRSTSADVPGVPAEYQDQPGASQRFGTRGEIGARGEKGTRDGPWIGSPEAMLHIGIAIIIGLMVSNAFRWALSVLSLAAPPPSPGFDASGQAVAYQQSIYFLHDGPIAMLAIGMVLEAIAVGVVQSRGLAWVAVGWLAISTAACGWAFVKLQAVVGTQFMPLVATVVGAYTAWSLAMKLKET